MAMIRKQALFLACLPVLLALALVDYISERFNLLRRDFKPMPDTVGIKITAQ